MTVVACKDCVAEGRTERVPSRLWRVADRPGPRCATHHRKWRRVVKERTAAQRVERTYGLDDKDYNAILAAQGGVCAICRRASGKTRRLAVDHDHETRNVRGLLCVTCNRVLLGWYDAAALQRALDYLERPPALDVIGLRPVPSRDPERQPDRPERGECGVEGADSREPSEGLT